MVPRVPLLFWTVRPVVRPGRAVGATAPRASTLWLFAWAMPVGDACCRPWLLTALVLVLVFGVVLVVVALSALLVLALVMPRVLALTDPWVLTRALAPAWFGLPTL